MLNAAADLARARGNGAVTTDDLFAAMVSSDCAASRLLADLGFNGAALTDQLAFILGRGQAEPAAAAPVPSPRVEKAIELAKGEAGRREATEVSTLHLLTAVLREQTGVPSLLLETPGLGLEPVGAALNRAIREGMTDLS